jgi:hypothetical protein
MTPITSGYPTAYHDINQLLAVWCDSIKNKCGDNLVGLYISGSLSYGDFVPGRSDIDLRVVLQNPLNKKELRWIEHLHKDLNKLHPGWKDRLECDYVPLELLKQRPPLIIVRPWWGFHRFYPTAPAGNEWIINQYFLCKYGLTMHGPEFSSLVPSIEPGEFRKASAMDLFIEWEPKTRDHRWFANSHNQSFLVLNLCRILHTISGCEPGSKKVAAEWTKKYYPQWRDLIIEAEKWEYGRKIKLQKTIFEFVKFSIRIAMESRILDESENLSLLLYRN